MKIFVKCLAGLFALLALGAAGLGVYTAVGFQAAPPVLVRVSPLAQERVAQLLSAAQQGDHARVEAVLLGTPSLGLKRPTEPLSAAVWDAYQDSLKFEILGAFYPTEQGLAVDCRVTRLAVAQLLEPVEARAQANMQELIAQAQRVEQIYDSQNEYRQDVVQQAVEQAVEQVLRENAVCQQMDFTVELVYQQGTWWALDSEELIDALTGGFGGGQDA